MHLRYRYRIYPAPDQVEALARAFGCARVVFNDGLRARMDAFAAGLPLITDSQLSARMTASKKSPEREWLAEVSSGMLQQALMDLNVGFHNFFNSRNGKRKGAKCGLPNFRSRKDSRQSIRFAANTKFKVLPNGRLRLPKIGEVKVNWSRPLPSVPSSVSVIKDSAGRYFASFVVLTDPAADAGRFPPADTAVGIDLGLTSFAVLSDGKVITAPKFLRRAERKIRRLQHGMSRKDWGSANREKARVKLARAHAKVADSRRDFQHKISTAIIRDNQAVYVEDLCVPGLVRTQLGKSIHDAGWATFRSMLEYKGARYGRTVTRIGRFVPTSQVCSSCGTKDGKKSLKVRVWTCLACGVIHDRDVNAAKNILAAGLAERLNACGG
jgi:putative transposase